MGATTSVQQIRQVVDSCRALPGFCILLAVRTAITGCLPKLYSRQLHVCWHTLASGDCPLLPAGTTSCCWPGDLCSYGRHFLYSKRQTSPHVL